ncbi:MAG: alpha/beta hydrolase-fold protein [Saprospiraceae bacterium]|nr:DUF3471 domain-containing protein [Lewinella sp.]
MNWNPVRPLCLLFCATLFWTFASAQPEGEPITIGQKFTLHSDVLDEDRPYLVGLPDDYETSERPYPVLYVLDGDGHFHHTTGTVKFLSRSGRIPEMIVVAIPNTTDRTRDLTPPILKGNKDQFPTAGGADNMLRFISDELMPQIEKDYRTAPYKVLIGHSFGGLFAVHTMVHRPEMFDAYLAISPSLWWDEQTLVDQAETYLKANPEYDANLYMTMANEGGTMLGGAWKLSAVLEESAPNMSWEFRLMDEEDHGSIPHRSTYYGLETIFKDYKDIKDPMAVFNNGGLEAIAAYYKRMEEKFGVKDAKAPENLINQIGYQLLAESRIDEAITVFQKNVEDYPKSFNVYDSLAEAYKEKGDKEKAEKLYRKSLEMNPANDNAVKMLAEMGITYKPEEVAISENILQAYTGKYSVNPDMWVSITLEDGQLWGAPNGGNKVKLYPTSEKKFYIKEDDVQVEFHLEAGKAHAESITVYQRGQGMEAKRME